MEFYYEKREQIIAMNKEYEEVISAAGIKKGDVLDIASDYPSLFFYFKKRGIKFDANQLLDGVIEAVGPEGTVLVRTFNWDFCHEKGFDVSKTCSQVGELGNVCMKRNDFRRTKHPLYSWMVVGKYADEICSMTNTCSFGKGTPWEFFEFHHGKMIILGNTRALGLTCLHHIEQELQMPYRYEKEFTGIYTDEYGEKTERTYSMYVRKLDRQVLFDDAKVHDNLINNGLMEERLLDSYLKVSSIDYAPLYKNIRGDLSNGSVQNWVVLKPLEDEECK